jgi:DNA-binding transcriptional ArsR family regulator
MKSSAESANRLRLLQPDAEPLLHRVSVGMCQLLRLQLLAVLAQGERSVTELTELLQRTQPTISKHLRVLRDQDLVRTRRQRNRVYYRLTDDAMAGEPVRLFVEALERSLSHGDRRG